MVLSIVVGFNGFGNFPNNFLIFFKMSQDVDSKWVTAAQAMQYLGVSRTKMWQLRRNDELKYAVHGRKVYILRKSMDDYIERYSVELDFAKRGGSCE